MKTIVVYAFAFVVLVNGIQAEEKKQICTPGSQTKEDCNTCTCNQDGTALGCTRMACPKIPAEYLNPDGSIKLPHEITGNPLLRTKRGIQTEASPEETKQICTPGSQSKQDCNTCTCNQDGTALGCTRMECPQILAEYLNPDGSLKLPHQITGNPLLRAKRDQFQKLPRERRDLGALRCTPNESFRDDCNTCFCSRDGRSAACTLMACPPKSNPIFNVDGSIKRPHQNNPLLRTKRAGQICKPNTLRVWECNECHCSSDGSQEICTRRVCPIIPRHRRDVPFSCVPNETFKQDCNTCFCSSDGRSAGCTLIGCPSQNSALLFDRSPEIAT